MARPSAERAASCGQRRHSLVEAGFAGRQRKGARDVRSLVFLEHHEGELVKGSLGVLWKAASLGGDVAGLVAGSGVHGLAPGGGEFGAAKVYVADDPRLEAPLPQPRVDVLARIVREGGFDAVLFGQSVLASDVAAGLAARLEAGLNWDLVDIRDENGRLVGTLPALADSVVVEVGWHSQPALALFRTGSFEPVATGGHAEVEELTVELEDFSTRATMIEQAHEERTGPSIEDADVIVAGGRGLGAPERFGMLEDLAKALGGAVAATRAVVDAGWYPYAAQVGQTGRTVSPKLYIACGISGAIQHKVGMQGSGTVVAINKDPNAPIFEFSDLGVVGDLHEIVPKLTELVRSRKS
jgi:electron transfer flavoprotein alpha subunit